MASQSTHSIKQKAVSAMLTLAAARPFAEVTLADIAVATDISLVDLHSHISSRQDLLSAWSLQLDKSMVSGMNLQRRDESPRDRLFELLMARFDSLNDNRAGAQSILRNLRTSPPLALTTLPMLARAMAWTLEAAGLATVNPKGILTIAGLTALYLKTLHVWLEDETTDLSATMAALDKNLGLAAQWAERLRF